MDPGRPAASPFRPLDGDNPATLAGRLKLGDGVAFLARVLSARADLLFQQLTGQDAITPRQFGALLTLYQQGSLTLTELSVHIRVDRSTLGEMVRRMGARGLLSRTDNPDDRRSARVAITPAGTAALLGLVQGAAKLQGALLDAVPAADRAGFLRALKRSGGTPQPGPPEA